MEGPPKGLILFKLRIYLGCGPETGAWPPLAMMDGFNALLQCICYSKECFRPKHYKYNQLYATGEQFRLGLVRRMATYLK